MIAQRAGFSVAPPPARYVILASMVSKSPASYEDLAEQLDQFGRFLCFTLARVMKAKKLDPHSITYRVKSLDSANRKLASKPERYKDITDLTDLLGLRLITYFDDDVDRVSEIIQTEFDVDEDNSIDKRKALDPDRFGYVSVHFILSMNDTRSGLLEYSSDGEFKFELQIRSILQHAWAEIEHDLGYKSASAIPRTMRRRFSRLAGILEIADAEFVTLRTELSEYERKVSGTPEEAFQDLELNLSTATAYVERSATLKRLDRYIAELFPARALSDEIDPRIDIQLELLEALGIRTVAELDESVKENKAGVAKLANAWLSNAADDDSWGTEIPTLRGISFFYLWYFLLAAHTTPAARSLALDKVWPGQGEQLSDSLMSAYTTSSTVDDPEL